VPTTAACLRPRDVGVRRAVRVALDARAGGVYTGPTIPALLEPLLSPPRFIRSDRGAPAPPALHLAEQAFSEGYSEGHPLVRPLTPTWRPVAR